MKKTIVFILLLILSFSGNLYAQDEVSIWNDFVSRLKKGEITVDDIRPYPGLQRETLLGFLNGIRENVDWKEMEIEPEYHKIENKIHFLMPLTFEASGITYNFSFIDEDNKWFFHHLETITIRLDRVNEIPAYEFPDIPDNQKQFMREETRWSREIYLYNSIKEKNGKEYALNLFKDGYGYFLAAKTWVPLVPHEKAFILYLCWHQENLRGNDITLEKLSDNEAVVRENSVYLTLYKISAHLRHQIPYEEYLEIYETIWRDRAEKAGWNVEFTFDGRECVFRFYK
ncbi:hypothetical protein ACFL6G_04685 [candidate division KSB1 bacterium]